MGINPRTHHPWKALPVLLPAVLEDAPYGYKHGVPLALRSPRKEEDEGKKPSPYCTSSKRAAPHAAQQRIGAPSKPIFKQIASACQFTSPSRSTSPEVWPQSSALRAGGPAGMAQVAMPLHSTPSPGSRPCQPMGAGPIYTTPRQVGAGDPPTQPKATATSWQHTWGYFGQSLARTAGRGACT